MKPLRSIINKLSPNEIGTFRMFLSSHCRNGKSKKLELFDYLVSQTSAPASSNHIDVSRQSVYQLKKRLKEELYSFLIIQDQVKDGHDQFFLEMDCHKKLYCFKILFDKGIHDHAYQMLDEVLNVASKHSLHSLYLEAVNLRNIYFPLSQTKVIGEIPVNHQIKKLKKSLGRNLYTNQYLSESGNWLHESDTSFRDRLINQLTDLDLAECEPIIDRLMEVNHLFYQRDFGAAYEVLLGLIQSDADISGDANMLSVIYIELTKACICVNELEGARKWLAQAQLIMVKSDPFGHVLLELRFIIALRSGDTTRMKEILDYSKRMSAISKSDVLTAKWSFYSLFMNFQEGDFKKVIKEANVSPVFLFKGNSWLMNVKMLELLSIYQLEDSDWLYYKIESLRKVFGGSELKQHRITQLVNLLKTEARGKKVCQSEAEEKIQKIEIELPWHPLSNELINYCTYIKAMIITDRHILLADSRS